MQACYKVVTDEYCFEKDTCGDMSAELKGFEFESTKDKTKWNIYGM